MERTKFYEEPKMVTNQQLMTLASEVVARASLAASMGLQYGGDRDIYRALGYPTGALEYTDFYSRYIRQDMAKAIIDRPVRATWQGALELVESNESEDTEFEKEWLRLNRLLGIKTKLARLDRLTGIGRYGILLLGLDDVSSREGFEKPVKTGKRKLLYIKPYGEKSAKIKSFESTPSNERYGMPLIYEIEANDVDSGSTVFIKVHHTRIVHITDEPLESDIYGTPRLEAVFNRLMDLDKLVGGDAEMFWRGARPGYEGKVDPAYTMTAPVKEDLKDQIAEYENNLRRILINEGVELKSLAQQIADPGPHFTVQVSCLSAVTGIPQRVLMGSERGELASTQDTSEWKEYVQARREDHAEPNILRPLVDKMIAYGVLPQPKEDYTVKWNDLYSLSEKARVEIGKARATAIREYTYSPIAETIVPPELFMESCLGYTTEQITLAKKMRDDMISEEELHEIILKQLDPPEPEIVTAPGQTGAVKKPVSKDVKKPVAKK